MYFADSFAQIAARSDLILESSHAPRGFSALPSITTLSRKRFRRLRRLMCRRLPFPSRLFSHNGPSFVRIYCNLHFVLAIRSFVDELVSCCRIIVLVLRLVSPRSWRLVIPSWTAVPPVVMHLVLVLLNICQYFRYIFSRQMLYTSGFELPCQTGGALQTLIPRPRKRIQPLELIKLVESHGRT
jgi:hypothetical protein